MINRSTRMTLAIVLLLAIGGAVAMVPSEAQEGGIGGALVASGCTCHGGTASPDVTGTISGFPSEYEAGETYNLTLTVSGGPAAGGVAHGGFNLLVSNGDLEPVDNTTQAVAGTTQEELTHTDFGNDQRTWMVTWTAPDEDDLKVDARLLVNSADGSGDPTGDGWSSDEATSTGSGYSNTGAVLTWIVIALVLVALIGGGGFYVVKTNEITWDIAKPWLVKWTTTTNHKDIGILYFCGAMVFGLIGLLLSLLIRLQLVVPDNDLIPGGLFNQLTTMHGAVMVLFFVSPLSFGFANYVVPMQIGARDMAFPRMNALSFWSFFLGGLVAASGFLFGGAADAGWTFYAPLTLAENNPGAGITLALAGVVLLIVSVTVGTINFLVTIHRHRIASMPLMQMPMFTWMTLYTVIIMLIIFPALLAGGLQVVLDRHFDFMFFDQAHDGTTWWLHIFWFFGHPEVYVVLLPELGMLMDMIPTFTRRPLYGRRTIIYATGLATGLSVLVWAHHMFLTGINSFFLQVETLGTEMISVPFGLIFLAMLATFYKSKPDLNNAPMLFSLGALGIFLIGGVTGVYLSSVAMDIQLRGTYYLVAHFHFTLGAVAVGVLGAVYYWFPKMSGRMPDMKLSRIHFWMTFVGVNLTFIPLFNLTDMPRRIYIYGSDAGWAVQNLLASIGALIVFLAQLVFVWNLYKTMEEGEPAGDNPWRAGTLEWATTSPPPWYNFAVLPVMRPYEGGAAESTVSKGGKGSAAALVVTPPAK